MPSTINCFINGTCGGPPVPPLSPLPATSLNGRIDTLLINNVLTTRLSKDLTSTLRYRYYNNDNRTPMLLFRDYVRADGQLIATDRQNLPIQYRRENAGADLNWRPRSWMKTGVSYGWERYDRDLRETDITDEHSGKVFVDANPWDWVRLRSSFLQAQRRYNEYDALKNVGSIAYPPAGAAATQSALMRKFEMANRDRSKVDYSAEFMTPIQGLIVTPSFSWRHDKFQDNSATGGYLGLKQDKYWNAGVELVYAFDRATFMVNYLLEKTNRTMQTQPGPAGAASRFGSEIDDTVHTIIGSVNIAVIPNSLDLKLGYIYSQAKDVTNTYPLPSVAVTQFPDVKNNFQRFDAEAKYKLEQDLVRRLGWTGDVTAKLRYAYERNHMTNWAIDNMTPIMTGVNTSLFLASMNPNYTAQLITLSLAAKW
jgi:MtrB/PioB family decaheme-associated outer membrane protein